MFITETELKGLFVAQQELFSDHRGYFMERFRLDLWEEAVGPFRVIQENESFSFKGVVRGLHYQLSPYGQSKLVWVVRGAVRDVVVDMRPDSPTFGHHFVGELSDQNKTQLFIPKGFAHGFLVLSPEAVVQYMVDAHYVPEAERCLRFDDPQLGIDWGVPPDSCRLSEKDRQGLSWEAAMIEIVKR
ncbi:MAG: dTDP-4-dehydrorhamnose 3,5-epimerase [Bacteroidetes bacterium]|nr:dTDP-4-dehydrorhamnose 3,5-epimerase [Bacteroidota bacterium]